MEDAEIFRESEGFMRYHLAGGFSWNRLKDDRSVYGSGIRGGILLPETSVSGLAILLL